MGWRLGLFLKSRKSNDGGHLYCPPPHCIRKSGLRRAAKSTTNGHKYQRPPAGGAGPSFLDRPIDLFVHDSLNSTTNVKVELTEAALSSRGAIVVGGIDSNRGFQFTQALPTCPHLVASSSSFAPILAGLITRAIWNNHQSADEEAGRWVAAVLRNS